MHLDRLEPEAEEPVVIVGNAAFRALASADEPSAAKLLLDARAFLGGLGIRDDSTLAAFGLGRVDVPTLAAFGLVGRRRPAGAGVTFPTWMPSDPSRIVGLVRLTPAQCKHRFITAPVGIAGPVEVAQAPRVLLADHPVLALWLHQSGQRDVALVEQPSVLASLRDWLAGRDLVLLTRRANDLSAMRAALGDRGASLEGFVVPDPDNMSTTVRRALGLPEREPQVAPPITARLLTDLHSYSRTRLEAGEALEALLNLGLDTPDVVASYRIGFLPADYASALPRDAQRALVGHRCGNAIIIPALDDQGIIVDALIVRVHAGASPLVSFFDQPRGLLAPEIARGHADIIVTDTPRWLGRLFRQGYRNVLLLRGVDDARRNASRLLAAGVERVTVRARRAGDDLVGALQAVGLLVAIERTPVEDDDGSAPATPVRIVASPMPPALTPVCIPTLEPAPATVAPPPEPRPSASDLRLVEEDRQNEVAIFEAGPLRYAIELRDDGASLRRVTLRAKGQTCADRFDLSHEVQRQRFAGNAGRRVGTPAETIAGHVATLLPAVLALEDAREQAPTIALHSDERVCGLALLDAPDLLDRVAGDLSAMGWLGEERAKRILYLAGISRLLPQPTWAVYQADAGAYPWRALGCITAMTPPEARTVFHRITDAALTQADRSVLRHRLLLVDQGEALRPEAALALRVLYERGGIGWATAASGANGLGEARGPAAVLAAAAGPLDPRCRDCFLVVPVDESIGQTEAIMEQQRRRIGAGAPATDPVAIIARHHAAQRLLERLPVRIPFADRIIFPATRVCHRQEQVWFLGLVTASALLHQRQRGRDAGAIVASEADFAHVVSCTAGLLAAEGASINDHARKLLSRLYSARLAHFTMADLAGMFPDWTRWAFRAALADLLDFGHVEAPEGGRGRQKAYRLAIRASGASPIASGIRLRPTGSQVPDGASAAVGELAGVGGPGSANFIPSQTGT